MIRQGKSGIVYSVSTLEALKMLQTPDNSVSIAAVTPEQLKHFRSRFDLTQEALADHLGMSRNAVNLMEMGERPIMKVTELALDTIRRKMLATAKRRRARK